MAPKEDKEFNRKSMIQKDIWNDTFHHKKRARNSKKKAYIDSNQRKVTNWFCKVQKVENEQEGLEWCLHRMSWLRMGERRRESLIIWWSALTFYTKVLGSIYWICIINIFQFWKRLYRNILTWCNFRYSFCKDSNLHSEILQFPNLQLQKQNHVQSRFK